MNDIAGIHAQGRLVQRLDLRYVELSNSHSSLLALGNPTLRQLEDPIAYMQSCAAFLAEFGKHLAASAGTKSSAQAAARSITCNYCSSIFILTADKNACPNCGAPAATALFAT